MVNVVVFLFQGWSVPALSRFHSIQPSELKNQLSPQFCFTPSVFTQSCLYPQAIMIYIPHVHLLLLQHNYPIKCDSLNQTDIPDKRKVLIVDVCAPQTHQILKSLSQQQSQKPVCHVPRSEDSGSGFGSLRHVPARVPAAQRWQQQQVQKPLDRSHANLNEEK